MAERGVGVINFVGRREMIGRQTTCKKRILIRRKRNLES